MNMKLLTLAGLLLLLAIPAAADAPFTCESQDGKYHECRLVVPGTVTLTRQTSEAACIEGRTWGFRNGVLWVDHGCRAEFMLDTAFDQFLTCESIDGKPARCAADTGAGVHLVRTISDTDCRYGGTWGYDEQGIWVMSGCRAEFAVRAPVAPSIVKCESENNAMERCGVDTTRGVSLTRQLSENPCVINRTWGWDSKGIWVNEGCRGEFSLGATTVATTTITRPIVVTQPVIVQPVVVSVNPPIAVATADAVVLCESENNGFKRCSVDTANGINLRRQMSDSPCVMNETWGFDKDGIWVKEGCRGEFGLGAVQPVMISSSRLPNSLICESIDGRRNHCSTNTTAGVRLIRQISDASCQLNQTWGYDAHGIWVSNGCRAEFVLGGASGPPASPPHAASVLCESKDGKRNICAANTSMGVAVVKQLSSDPCILNSTWGYDAEGIWVTAGCRAQFILRK